MNRNVVGNSELRQHPARMGASRQACIAIA
jgi:hypothetical protein